MSAQLNGVPSLFSLSRGTLSRTRERRASVDLMSPPKLSVQSRFWLTCDGVSLAGRGRIELLQRIDETGSIRQAAMAMGMSYRAAWDAVDAMNQRAGVVLITRKTGGSRGGGAQLSEAGAQLVALFARLEAQHAAFIEELDGLIGTQWPL